MKAQARTRRRRWITEASAFSMSRRRSHLSARQSRGERRDDVPPPHQHDAYTQTHTPPPPPLSALPSENEVPSHSHHLPLWPHVTTLKPASSSLCSQVHVRGCACVRACALHQRDTLQTASTGGRCRFLNPSRFGFLVPTRCRRRSDLGDDKAPPPPVIQLLPPYQLNNGSLGPDGVKSHGCFM